MYKITKVTDKLGNIKESLIEQINEICPEMTGEILYKEFMQLGNRFCFKWCGDSGRIMRTSPIVAVSEAGNMLHVSTVNTEYWLEKCDV